MLKNHQFTSNNRIVAVHDRNSARTYQKLNIVWHDENYISGDRVCRVMTRTTKRAARAACCSRWTCCQTRRRAGQSRRWSCQLASPGRETRWVRTGPARPPQPDDLRLRQQRPGCRQLLQPKHWHPTNRQLQCRARMRRVRSTSCCGPFLKTPYRPRTYKYVK